LLQAVTPMTRSPPKRGKAPKPVRDEKVWPRSRGASCILGKYRGASLTRKDASHRSVAEGAVPDETILLAVYAENAVQARAHEQYRERITTITGALVGAVIGFLNLKNGVPGSVVLIEAAGAFVVLIGVFGLLASIKHYERHQLHIARLRQIRLALDFLPANAVPGRLAAINAAADAAQLAAFPRVKAWRLHVIWSTFHVLIIVLGVTLCVWAVTHVG
jgi:hypothetical protein